MEQKMIAASIKMLLDNAIFVSSICAFAIAQIIKCVLALLNIRDRNAKDIISVLAWKTGGMPSSHSALVSAMAVSAAFIEGTGSNVFIITFFFALVIIRDSLGVRRQAGLQAEALNSLGHDLSKKFGIIWQDVKVIQGHNPVEVAVGVSIGIIVSCIFHFSRLATFFS
jgi:acid phosphatase family membrane protein YuiD